MDIGTGLVLAGSAAASKDLLVKLLGPTTDYLGEGMKNCVQKSQKNLEKIFNHALCVLGSDIETYGEVSPRILKQIISEGAFFEDELTAEYFGGVLASSRSNNSKDDRGLTHLSVVCTMSSYQIRTHYIFYSIINNLFGNSELNIGNPTHRGKMGIFLPWSIYMKCMDPGFDRKDALSSHIFFGLNRLDLIGNFYWGDVKHLQDNYNEVQCPGIIFKPTPYGAELYLWAHGYQNTPVAQFFREEIQFIQSETLSIPDGATSIENLEGM